MRYATVFSGIGGPEVAADVMGWEPVFHCEINSFGRDHLSYLYPNAKSYEDIKTTDFTVWRGLVDAIIGGFPCQPYSSAGQRRGKEDDRHLWPEMLRAIREISPVWVVGENVRGLTNWNGGMVFDEVQTDLETEGYEVTPFLLPACAVNAPHRRDRIFFVAHTGCRIRERRKKAERQHVDHRENAHGGETADIVERLPSAGLTSHPNGDQRQPRREQHQQPGTAAAAHGSQVDAPYTMRNGQQQGGLAEDRQAQGEGEGNEWQRQRVRADAGGIAAKGDATNANTGTAKPSRKSTKTGGSGRGDDHQPQGGGATAKQHTGRGNVQCDEGDATYTHSGTQLPLSGNAARNGGIGKTHPVTGHAGGNETATDTNSIGCQDAGNPRRWRDGLTDNHSTNEPTDTISPGLQRNEWSGTHGEWNGAQTFGSVTQCDKIQHWRDWPTQSPVRSGNDGFSTGLLRQRIREDCMGIISEKEIDKILSKALTEWTNECLKAYGNAIVPPLIYQIFKAMQEWEDAYAGI